MKKLFGEIKSIETYEALLLNKIAYDFLRDPTTRIYYAKLRDLFLTNQYVKVKKRMTTSFFLRLSVFLVKEKHSNEPLIMQTLLSEIAHLCELLEKRPVIYPVIKREERTRILYIMANYFAPMLVALEESDIDELIIGFRNGMMLTEGDPLSRSDEFDLEKEFRDLPTCARCGDVSSRLCSICRSVSYCGIWCQQLHWPEHRQHCSEKKDK